MQQTNVTLINIISWIIPVLSIFISHFLGMKINNKKFIKEKIEKRYNNLYIPYIKALYESITWDKMPHQFTSEQRKIFLSIISNNLEYLDNKSLSLYKKFYSINLEYDAIENEYKLPYTQAFYDKYFFNITQYILLESKSLANELFLPELATPLFENYFLKCQINKLQ